MEKLNLIEKLEEIISIIRTSPLFLTIFIVCLSILTFILLDIKTTKKVREKFLIIIWLLSILYIGYTYFDYFIKLSDNLVEEVFTAIYFPNLAIYTIIVFTVNYVFISKMLNKKTNNYYKTTNLVAVIIIDFLLILVLETIIKNKINVYEPLTMYSNQNLLVLLELTSGAYTTWLFILGLLKLVFNKIGEPTTEIKEESIKEEAVIYKTDTVYTAPSLNVYDKSTDLPVIDKDINNYTEIFNIEPISYEKKFYINNLSKHIYIKSSKEKVYNVNDLSHHLYTKKSEEVSIIKNITKEAPIIRNIEKETKNKTFISLFNKKTNKEEENNSYRIPLFETLDEDPLLSMIEPIKNDTIIVKPVTVTTPIVENITFEIEEELFKKFKSGENLNVEQYKILKNYLIKRQG